jgi:hypothetical protein
MASILDIASMHDTGDLDVSLSDIAATVTLGSRLITAVRSSGRLRVMVWQIDGAGPVTLLGDSRDAAGEVSEIDVTVARRVVTACRTERGTLLLISWDVDANGAVSRVRDSGTLAGEASQISIVALPDERLVTACRNGAGDLLLICWRLEADGSFTRLADTEGVAGAVSEIALTAFTDDRVVTSVRDGAGKLKVILWSVSRSGVFSRRGDSANSAGNATLVRAAKWGREYLITSVRDGSGDLLLISWRIPPEGSVERVADSAQQAGRIEHNALMSLPDGVVSAIRDGSGQLLLISWKMDDGGNIVRRGDSGSQAGSSCRAVVALPGPAVPDINGYAVSMITAARTGSDRLRITTWGPRLPPLVGRARLHFKFLTYPAIAVDDMLAMMRQIFLTAGISLEVLSKQDLPDLPLLDDLDVGTCTTAEPLTAEQEELFGYRDGVGTNEFVVYFVRSITQGYAGCAVSTTEKPSAVVSSNARQWTLAHEVGHVLDLLHVTDASESNRLMFDGYPTKMPPELVDSERDTILMSTFVDRL